MYKIAGGEKYVLKSQPLQTKEGFVHKINKLAITWDFLVMTTTGSRLLYFELDGLREINNRRVTGYIKEEQGLELIQNLG